MNNFNFKKRTSNINFKLYLLIALSLFLSIGMGIGYSYIRKELSVNGKVEVLNGEAKTSGILGIDKIAYLDNEISTYVTSPTGIDFSKPSSDTNGKGLYIWSGTEKSAHPIYYYRGDVEDNNVIFAGFCWKIVRTTETGGIKIIYNGIASGTNTCTIDIGTSTEIGKSAYNERNGDEWNNGYMYTTTTKDDTSSALKNNIDKWYEEKIKSFEDYLEDTIWCVDRSIGSSSLYSGAENRFPNTPNPMTCPQKEDAFTVSDTVNGNGKLTYPIALLTVDEATLAGIMGTTSNYLYTSLSYWLITPNYISAGIAVSKGTDNVKSHGGGTLSHVYTIKSDGTITNAPNFGSIVVSSSSSYGTTCSTYSDSGCGSVRSGSLYFSNSPATTTYGVHLTRGVRPSVSLKPGTKATKGDGTPGDPYIID